MIKNIVFDLGNVILKDSPSIVLENLDLPNEDKQKIKEKFFDDWEDVDLGKETLEEHLNNCGLDLSAINNNIKEILLNYYKYRPFNNEIIELMHVLKEKKYKIYILSNNNKEVFEYLKKLPQFQCVDGWIVSCDYNMVKPNRELYIKLFDKFNIKPEECFFIDDKKENIETAELLGMQGCVLDIKNKGLEILSEKLRDNTIK